MSLIGAVARSARNLAPVPYVGPGQTSAGLFGGMFQRGNMVTQM